MMKKKKQPAQYTDKRRLKKKSWIIIILCWLALSATLLYLQIDSSALPGAKYRYSAGSCKSSDAECFKYSAQGGVYRVYRATLNRNPESSGMSYWTQRLRDGTSINTMATYFINSGEWKQKFPSISNSAFVNNTYRYALRRTPSQSDQNYWTNQLNQGSRTRGQVASYFVQTSESANTLHASFMNYYRPPTPTPTPRIGAVSPNPMRGSNSSRQLTIYGRDFVSGAKVTLRDRRLGKTFTNRQIISRSSTRIVIRSNFFTANATWTAQVINPGNRGSNMYAFRVTAPPRPTTPRPSAPPRPANPQPVIPQTSTQTSSTGLKITNFKITQISYRSARITWKTNKSVSGTVKYGTTKENLASEKRGQTSTRSHAIVLNDTETIKAGNRYFVQAVSLDKDKPVSIRGEFSTKPVGVIIKVTDTDDEPLEAVQVNAGDQSGTTNTEGEVTLNVPEGDLFITAQKDDLYRELEAFVEVPADTELPAQRITLNLGEFEVQETIDNASTEPQPEQESPVVPIVLGVLGTLLLAGGIFFFLRRRKQSQHQYIGDALEAENYAPVSAPPETSPLPPPVTPSQLTTPEPSYMSLEQQQQLPRHTSLPEMLGRYGTQTAQDVESNTPTVPTPTVPTPSSAISPTGQPIEQHSSLKELVQTPVDQASQTNSAQPLQDLPVSPVAPPAGSQQQIQTDQAMPKSAGPDDDTLTINH